MHVPFLEVALEQAWLGRGQCAPNPAVGAVAVIDGEIIAKGWHQGVGSFHAERVVLDKIPQHIKNLNSITLYVTLEPCNHWGKTPPCVDVIINNGVRKVIYGYSDPNPLVSNNDTPALLKEHGIVVEHHPTEAINSFYESYCFWMATKRPWVTAKLAHSLDANIAGYRCEPIVITNHKCLEFTHLNRLHADVILTSSKTVASDDPRLDARIDDKCYAKTVAIIAGSTPLSNSSKVLRCAKRVIVYYNASNSSIDKLEGCEYYPVSGDNEHHVDLQQIIYHLGGLGFHDVWVEAGASIFNALHNKDLVQRSYIYIAPKIIGKNGISAYGNVNIFEKNHQVHWMDFAGNAVGCFEWRDNQCLPE